MAWYCMEPNRRIAIIKTNELSTLADSLDLDLKIQLIEKLLNSLNPPQKEINRSWADEAGKRVSELKSGKVASMPEEAVFKDIQKRLSA